VRSGTEYGAAGRGCLRVSFSASTGDIEEGAGVMAERFARQRDAHA